MQSTSSIGTPAFFEEHYARIYRYVVSLVRDSVEAEDLTQETFLRAYSQRDSLRDAEGAVSWLYRIATHVCLDQLRQRARRENRRVMSMKLTCRIPLRLHCNKVSSKRK